MLNRIAAGKYASVDDMLNEPRQFSKITGPARLHPYGSVAATPMPSDEFLADWDKVMRERAGGLRSDVTGGGRNYLNPAFADRRSLDAWGDYVVAQGRGYGVGDITQYYGTAPGQLPVAPFNLNLGTAATGLQGLPSQLAQNLAPELSKFTSALSKADGGLGQFASSIASAAKGLFGGLGDLGGVGGSLGGGLGSLFGFAEGGFVQGDGTGDKRQQPRRGLGRRVHRQRGRGRQEPGAARDDQLGQGPAIRGRLGLFDPTPRPRLQPDPQHRRARPGRPEPRQSDRRGGRQDPGQRPARNLREVVGADPRRPRPICSA